MDKFRTQQDRTSQAERLAGVRVWQLSPHTDARGSSVAGAWQEAEEEKINEKREKARAEAQPMAPVTIVAGGGL